MLHILYITTILVPIHTCLYIPFITYWWTCF